VLFHMKWVGDAHIFPIGDCRFRYILRGGEEFGLQCG